MAAVSSDEAVIALVTAETRHATVSRHPERRGGIADHRLLLSRIVQGESDREGLRRSDAKPVDCGRDGATRSRGLLLR